MVLLPSAVLVGGALLLWLARRSRELVVWAIATGSILSSWLALLALRNRATPLAIPIWQPEPLFAAQFELSLPGDQWEVAYMGITIALVVALTSLARSGMVPIAVRAASLLYTALAVVAIAAGNVLDSGCVAAAHGCGCLRDHPACRARLGQSAGCGPAPEHGCDRVAADPRLRSSGTIDGVGGGGAGHAGLACAGSAPERLGHAPGVGAASPLLPGAGGSPSGSGDDSATVPTGSDFGAAWTFIAVRRERVPATLDGGGRRHHAARGGHSMGLPRPGSR